MLEERGPGDADVGPADDHAIDVPLDAAACRLEAELPAVTALGQKLEARGLEPADGQFLELMPRREDAQRLARESLVRSCGVWVYS